MNLLAAIDQILQRADSESPDTEEDDELLGLPAGLTGINLKGKKEENDKYRENLEKTLGREIHPAVSLLDQVSASDSDTGQTIEDFCLLKKTALRDLLNAALYDNLTGLYARNIFESRLWEEFRRAKRYDQYLSVLFIDIDSFKTINDTYGHSEGDRVLAHIGRFIRDHLREVDFPVRYGGEEFVIILPHTAGETALSLAQRIHGNIGKAQKEVGFQTRVTVSIGVGTLIKDMQSENQLIDAADQAVYKAKRAGKNMVWPKVNAED